MAPGALPWAAAVASAAGLLAARGRKGAWLIPLCLVAFIAASLPLFGGLSLAGFLRGIGGDLSVPSLVLLGTTLLALAGGPDARTREELLPLALVVVSAAVFLYPMALGLTRFDPYALGYRAQVPGLLLVLGCLALASALSARHVLLVSLLGAVAAWSFALSESPNLWDYLLDPWLSIFEVIWLLRYLRSSARSPNLGKPSDASADV